jgi:hypothetical protein
VNDSVERNVMRTRNVTFAAAAAAAALVLGIAGCGDTNSCSDQTPPLVDDGAGNDGVPDCTNMAASTRVTVQLGVCPRCDQGAPTCTPDLTNVGSGIIELVPLAPVCDANPSCPIVDPSSCPLRGVTCSFTAPAAGPYQIVVVDTASVEHTGAFDVVAGGANTSCTL